MFAVPLFIMDPLWSQFEAFISPIVDEHPLGCHRPRGLTPFFRSMLYVSP